MPPPTFANILVPVDFSPASRSGVLLAADLAARFDGRLSLVYVIEPPLLPEWGYAHLTIRDAKLRKQAETQLPEFVHETGVSPSLIRSTAILSGEPDGQICRAAEQADMIVLASHGLGGVKHAILGSTVERVTRHTSRPVLTFRHREGSRTTFAPKRILLATDFSDASKKAFPSAEAFARGFGSTLVLLYVLPGHLPPDLSLLGEVFQEQRLLEKARQALPRFREAYLDPDLPVETLVRNGPPAPEICKAAETESCDLIVIATHGHTGIKHLMIGSVTERVLRHSPCPVLVVPERGQPDEPR